MSRATWFFDNGVGVFPIRPGTKEPACKSWDDHTCTRGQAARFKDYAVRLTRWLAVADTDNAGAEAWVAAHLPATPFMVRTARGVHRYYRIVGPQPKFIYRDGIKAEFRNEGQYVIGPGSVHPSGSAYTASDWSWVLTDLPIFPRDFLFDDRQPQPSSFNGNGYEFPAEVFEPGRHDELFKLLRSFKGLGADKDTAREVVHLANQHRCRPPLKEDHVFEAWFNRAWNNPDRPLTDHRSVVVQVVKPTGWL